MAMNHGRGSLMLKEIAQRQQLPAAYLEQLMSALKRADLVTATRGAKGGYVLSRHPSKIDLAQVVEALEGPIELSDCPEGAACCGRPESCAVIDLWHGAQEALVGHLEGVTLAQLAESQRDKELGSVPSYII